jgi:hypothetical protein
MKVTPSSGAHKPLLSYQAARAFAGVPADCCPCEKDGCCCCC